MLTTKGDINPPNSKKILWGIIQSVMAVGLLMAGGLKPLQTISLAAAFPFIFIMFAACAAFIKALKGEKGTGVSSLVKEPVNEEAVLEQEQA